MLQRTYSELIKLKTFDERFEYLKLWDSPHVSPDDSLYRKFLKSKIWLDFREDIYTRDLCQDLGTPGHWCDSSILIHHINPITTEDLILERYDVLLNPENVITTQHNTHNRLHYKPVQEEKIPIVNERKPGDTTLW